MNQKPEYRSAAWESEKDGHIHGYAVVFNSRTVLYRDPETGIEYGEIIDPHALDTADLRDVVLRVDHEGSVLARTRNHSLTLSVDSYGLKVDADLSGSQESRNTYESIKNGLYDKMSFAFVVADNGDSYDNKTRTRTIRSIERLYDVAVVTFPAYEQTSVSARSKYTGYAEEDRNDFHRAENKKTMDEINAILVNHDIAELRSESFITPPGIDLTEREKIYQQMIEIRERCSGQAQENRSLIGSEPIAQLHSLEDKLVAMHQNRSASIAAVIGGKGKSEKSVCDNPTERKIFTLDEIRTNFYKSLIEKRAAAGTTLMSDVIPVEILDHVFREGYNGLLPFVSLTHISNGGNVKIPYLRDTARTVNEHVENAAIVADSYVPNVVTIDHKEYQQTLGYSYLGMSLAAADMRNIVEDALVGAMNVQLDKTALDAINALTWSTTDGPGKNAVNWATAGSPLLSEILDLMKMLPAQYSAGAKFFMNKATILSVIQNSTGNTDSNNSNAMYNVSVLDGLTRLFGTQVIEDSNLATGVVFYGKPSAVHMNIAGEVQFANWLDRDALTEKFQIACAAGASCEIGAFVKGSNS